MKNFAHFTSYSDEKVYAVIHRHWFNVARQYIPIFFFVLFLTITTGFISTLGEAIDNDAFTPLLYFIVSLLYLMTWIYIFIIWVDYHLDIWVITSSRVLNIEQKGFFSRTISELEYSHIQDVTSDIHGIIPTALNYGDVNVQTAGTHGRFTFRNIAHPEKIKTLVMHLHRQALGKRAHPAHVATEQTQQAPPTL